MTFVKSADTKTSAVNSRAELDKMLRRYGATHISVAEDIAARKIVLTFVVPNSKKSGAQMVPVKLPVSVAQVYTALYGDKPRTPSRDEQANRVAWRNLVLWVDAALSATVVGLQTISEAFFAHAVIDAEGTRMIEAVARSGQDLGQGVRLLTSETR